MTLVLPVGCSTTRKLSQRSFGMVGGGLTTCVSGLMHSARSIPPTTIAVITAAPPASMRRSVLSSKGLFGTGLLTGLSGRDGGRGSDGAVARGTGDTALAGNLATLPFPGGNVLSSEGARDADGLAEVATGRVAIPPGKLVKYGTKSGSSFLRLLA